MSDFGRNTVVKHWISNIDISLVVLPITIEIENLVVEIGNFISKESGSFNVPVYRKSPDLIRSDFLTSTCP